MEFGAIQGWSGNQLHRHPRPEIRIDLAQVGSIAHAEMHAGRRGVRLRLVVHLQARSNIAEQHRNVQRAVAGHSVQQAEVHGCVVEGAGHDARADARARGAQLVEPEGDATIERVRERRGEAAAEHVAAVARDADLLAAQRVRRRGGAVVEQARRNTERADPFHGQDERQAVRTFQLEGGEMVDRELGHEHA